MMKDSYRSANRYLLNHFRHTYRQALIDLMQGIPVTEDLQALIRKENPGKAKRLRREREEAEAMIGICSSLLIPRNEEFLGGWLCFHCSPSLSEAASEELGVLLLLSDQACYFAHCNKELEVTDYSRIGLEDLQRIEIGRFPIIIKQSQTYFMRFHYTCTGKSGYQHTLRAGPQHHGHNPRDTLQAIAKMVQSAKRNATGAELPVRIISQNRSVLVGEGREKGESELGREVGEGWETWREREEPER
uniref:Phosphatidylinositide phosphatase SAC2-like n=1 Tax=Callorhinchus milii TaxID=7868 RepID=A0A4W3H159_CALMI